MRVIQVVIVAMMACLLSVVMVRASPFNISDVCYQGSGVFHGGDEYGSVLIRNTCMGSNEISWVDPINISVLGDIVDNDVVIGRTWMFVDSVLRPDLDQGAILKFHSVPFAVEPDVLKDGTTCSSCNVSFHSETGIIEVSVDGFSNYSLTSRKDFTVYSDTAPELDNKVYQTVDLGDSRRATEYACIVQVFGQSAETPGQWVLVQTNPQREVQAKLLGNPDPNQPESLGYFKTTGGMANVYFRDQNIPGYNDFEYVIQCSSNSTKLIYEESISTRYHPMGRNVIGRGVWLASGLNGFYIVIEVMAGLIFFWIILMMIRRSFHFRWL